MSVFKAKDSEGSITADLTGIQATMKFQFDNNRDEDQNEKITSGGSHRGDEHHPSAEREREQQDQD